MRLRYIILSLLMALLCCLSIDAKDYKLDLSKTKLNGGTIADIENGWAVYGAAAIKSTTDYPIVDKDGVNVANDLCVEIKSGTYSFADEPDYKWGHLTFKGNAGLKKLKFSYSCGEDGYDTAFEIRIKQNGIEQTYDGHTKSMALLYDDESPIALKYESDFNIEGDFELRIINTIEKTDHNNNIVFWNIEWSDNEEEGGGEEQEEPETPPAVDSDDNLYWSQKPGCYLPGTIVMVSGNQGQNLVLKANGFAVDECKAHEGVVPTIKYTLTGKWDVLEAESGDESSTHFFTTDAENGSQPSLALSLPEGTYNPYTDICATGLIGTPIEIKIESREPDEYEYMPSADNAVAAFYDFQLKGYKGDICSVTVSSGGHTLKRDYTLSEHWIPVDALAALNFQEASNLKLLKSGQPIPLEFPTDGNSVDMAGETVCNGASTNVWIKFDELSNAKLVKNSDDGSYSVELKNGDWLTVGISELVPTGAQYNLNSIIFYHDNFERSFNPGNQMTYYNYHLWTPEDSKSAPVMKAVSDTMTSENFKVTNDVKLKGIEVDHKIITRVENVAVDSDTSVRYYGLNGSQLQQAPASGLYIEQRGGKARLVRARSL